MCKKKKAKILYNGIRNITRRGEAEKFDDIA